MSEAKIVEVQAMCDNLNSAHANAQTDDHEEKSEMYLNRATANTLLQVEELVDELHEFHRVQVEDIRWLGNVLPDSLLKRIHEVLPGKGLAQLPSRNRQAARLRIMEAIGLCLENARCVQLLDKGLVGWRTELCSSEVEALYRRRLESSTALEQFVIRVPENGKEDLEPETWRLVADFLLREDLEEVEVPLFQLAEAATAKVRAVSHPAGRRVEIAPKLKRLYTRIRALADEAIAEETGEFISTHQSLLALEIVVDQTDEDEKDDEYSGACVSDRGETSVRTVSIGEKKMAMGSVGRLLSKAFLVCPRNTSVHSLSICYLHRGIGASVRMVDLEVLSRVLQMGIQITKFGLCGLDCVRSRDLRGFFKDVLVHGTHLQSLHLSQDIDGGSGSWGLDEDSFALLVELLQSESMSALKELKLDLSDTNSDFEALDWPSFYTSLTLSQLESVNISGYVGYEKAERAILQWIQRSKSLQKLNFRGRPKENINWRSIFRSLKENTSLKSVKVSYKALEDDEAFRELMEVLQVNSTLEEVTTDRGKEGPREAAVREGLKCKARRESYLAELRKGLGRGPAEWQSPKCGRVFLCGSPEAGKTVLTRTMRKLAKKSHRKRLVERFLRRTEGVEIHTLRDDEQMQILLWDLAGQDIFRALQQFLFPRLSRASVFIFVFSPFIESTRSRGNELKPGLQNAFEKELLEWLRFIVSNSAVSGFNLPQMMVVISHQDIYEPLKIDLKWCNTVLSRLIPEFADVIYIHETPYFIDGHEPHLVEPIVDHVYSIFQELFRGKLFKVPTACSDLSQQLVRWVSKNQQDPIIDDQTFFSLCAMIPDLRPFSEKCHEDDDSKRLLKAVGSYLHDVGTVIDMTMDQEVMDPEKLERPKSNLIVVNPNWLTHVFLGRFICFGQGFQLDNPEEVEWAKRSVDGFMRETDFQHLLCTRFLEPMKKQFPQLSLETLQYLMENLGLLYVTSTVDQKGHNDSLYFIPTFFKTQSEQTLHWHRNTCAENTGLGGETHFLGLRLCCKDQDRTYLSSAFFSRFQVEIWRKFTKGLQLNNPVIDCKFNLISILVDGFDIFIEKDEAGDFIDVLIRSNKSPKIVWHHVEEYLVKELFNLCASSRGSPGVELVIHIIRTECVKRLTPIQYRKGQSVPKEDLKRQLMISIQKLGPGSEETDLYSHTWKSVPEIQLEAEWEKAVELLSPDDVHEAYALIQSRTQSLQEKVDRLKDVMVEVDIESEELTLGALGVQSNKKGLQKMLSLQKEEKEFGKSSNRERDDNIMQEIRDLKGDVRRVGQDVKKVLEEVRDLKLEIQNMNRLHQKAEENLTLMYHKLDQLMGHSISTTVWPKRPYFSHKDVNLCHRIAAVIEIGKPLMLHFQCEEIHGHHIVPDQPGHGITVGRENCEAVRQISKSSVRVLRYLLKAGLNASGGIAALLPELEISDGNVTSLTSSSIIRLLGKVQIQDGRSSHQPTDPCSPEEAWKYLQDFLKSNLNSRITECFLLHSAEYFDSECTRAWLCQDCLAAGLKGNKLRKL